MSTPAERHATECELILVINCGTSSLKFALFESGQAVLPSAPAFSGKVQDIDGTTPMYRDSAAAPAPVDLGHEHLFHAALVMIRDRVAAQLGGRCLAGVVHCVVHGAGKYQAPVRVDVAVLADLKEFIPLAPLHQPFAREAIEAQTSIAPAKVALVLPSAGG